MLVTQEYENKIAASTRNALVHNQRILEIHYLESDDTAHVKHLLKLFSPPDGCIADMGCGVGDVSQIMERLNPNLFFLQVNNNQWQLDQCKGVTWYANMEDTGLPEQGFDGIMYNYSIGYCDLSELMEEAARLLRPGGVLFIYDISGSSEKMSKLLEYNIHSVDEVCNAAKGFNLDKVVFPDTSIDHFMRVIGNSDLYNELFLKTRPTAWRFIRSK